MNEPITTPKLIDMSPRWADFRGWTILFDNPANRTGDGPIARLDVPLDDERHGLYRSLCSVSGQIETAVPGSLIAWLPADTYHVTVADGLSTSHVDRLRATDARRLKRSLEKVLEPPIDPHPPTSEHETAIENLCSTVECSPVEYRVTAVTCRGHALLADLVPTPASRAHHDRIARTRRKLLHAIGHQTGLDLDSEWRPHVTLGYLANSGTAHEIADHLTFDSSYLGSSTVKFETAGVYVFTTMVDYWRPNQIR